MFSISLGIAIFLAGFLHLQNSQTYPASHISHFISATPQQTYLIGKVASSPEVSRTFYGSRKTTFTFRVEDLKVEEKWQAVEGLTKVSLYGERRVVYGDELLLQGSLERPPGLRNPGGFNYREYLANHQIFGILKVKEKNALLSMGGTPQKGPGPFLQIVLKLKRRLRGIVYRYLQSPQAALLSAILLGERAGLSQDIKDLFISTGTVHILPTQYTKKPNYRASRFLTL